MTRFGAVRILWCEGGTSLAATGKRGRANDHSVGPSKPMPGAPEATLFTRLTNGEREK